MWENVLQIVDWFGTSFLALKHSNLYQQLPTLCNGWLKRTLQDVVLYWYKSAYIGNATSGHDSMLLIADPKHLEIEYQINTNSTTALCHSKTVSGGCVKLTT